MARSSWLVARRSWLVAGLFTLSVAGAAAQTAQTAQTVETDPLQCWWRTSAGAVRVGEPFSAVLTCAVLETDDVKIVVDESRLEPSVMQVVPFEVLGGVHAADLRTADRRFFQYEYRLRLISENQFGKDVALPETKLSYRVQSKVGQKTAVEGRDQTYLLPPLSMRLISLVPSDASDIRDASAETFGDLDQRAFRASLLVVALKHNNRLTILNHNNHGAVTGHAHNHRMQLHTTHGNKICKIGNHEDLDLNFKTLDNNVDVV